MTLIWWLPTDELNQSNFLSKSSGIEALIIQKSMFVQATTLIKYFQSAQIGLIIMHVIQSHGAVV